LTDDTNTSAKTHEEAKKLSRAEETGRAAGAGKLSLHVCF